ASYGLPETLSAGKIIRIVDEFTEVKPGTVLIEYDTTLAKADLEEADVAVKEAEARLLQTQMMELLHTFDVALQEIAARQAAEEQRSAEDIAGKMRDKLERELGGTNSVTALAYTEAEKTRIRNEQFEIMKAAAAARSFAAKAEAERKKLDKVNAVNPSLD